MKNRLAIALFHILYCSTLFGQLQSSGTVASFSIDGDLLSSYSKFGYAIETSDADDWFLGGSGKSIIDTTGASYFKSILQGNNNISFSRGMSLPRYSVHNNVLWLDAMYVRDYCSMSSPSYKDSTCFTFASKNVDNPNVWVGGVSSFTSKSDLVDAFAHFRRNGSSISDSLWFFTGLTTIGTSGSRYFDIELYANPINYDGNTGAFSSNGTEAGHTAWLFDAAGNVTRTGDLILAVTFTPGSAPVIDLRIWVSQTVYSTVLPSNFKFGSLFDKPSGGTYGYAQIVSNSGGTQWGAGCSNYSGNATIDTTMAAPWGTTNAVGWNQQYEQLQFVEIGLNFTRIGLDPYLYTLFGLNACSQSFNTILFKSRSSASFTSNLQDFVGPKSLSSTGFTNYNIIFDSLSCDKKRAAISIIKDPSYSAGHYAWSTTNGQILEATTDSASINVGAAGIYYLSSSIAVGCPVLRKDTVHIVKDDFKPVATADIFTNSNISQLYIYGGDSSLSNYLTPFGRSSGLIWNWSGPSGFSASTQNTINDTVWGTYTIILTEMRNGCKDTADIDISLKVLGLDDLLLEGRASRYCNTLNWTSNKNIPVYSVERSVDGNSFSTIATILSSTTDTLKYNDMQASNSNHYYRISYTDPAGKPRKSNIVRLRYATEEAESYVLYYDKAGQEIHLEANEQLRGKIMVLIHTVDGRLLYSSASAVDLASGRWNKKLFMPDASVMKFVSVYYNDQLCGTIKVL